MKAKVAAKEIVDRFINITPCNDNELSEDEMYKEQLHIAKQCALICVDEMLGNYEEKYKYCKSKQFLEEVKQEINKL